MRACARWPAIVDRVDDHAIRAGFAMCDLRFAILSEPQASSEIKGNPQLLENLLILSKIFVTQLVEAAGLFEVLEEGIDLLAELIVSFADPNSPFFGLKGFKDCSRRILMAFPELENRDLVVDHTVRFSLSDLGCAGRGVTKGINLRVVKMLDRGDMARGSLLHRDSDVGFVHIIDGLDRAILIR